MSWRPLLAFALVLGSSASSVGAAGQAPLVNPEVRTLPAAEMVVAGLRIDWVPRVEWVSATLTIVGPGDCSSVARCREWTSRIRWPTASTPTS
jgi:hypothetical protein